MKRPRCRRRHTRRPAHVRRWSEKRRLNSRSDIRAVVRATPAAPAEAPHETNRIGSRHQHVVVPTSTQFGQHSRGLDAGSPGDFLCREGRRGASTPHHRSRITQNPCRSGMAPISSITGRYLLDFERHGSGRRAACASEIHRVIPAEDRWCLITRDSGLGARGSGLGARGSGLGARGSGLGTRDSGLGTRGSGLGEGQPVCVTPAKAGVQGVR